MKKEVRLGILALITIVASIWGYTYIKGQNVFQNVNVFTSKFEEVNGLEIAAPIMVKGYKVGDVIDIQLNPDDAMPLSVTYNVEDRIRIPKDAKAQLISPSIMGGRQIELIFDAFCNTNCAESGDLIQGNSVGLLGSMISENEIDSYIGKLSPTMDTVFNKLKEADPNNPIGNTILNLEETMVNLNNMTKNINRLLSNTEQNLSKTMSNLNDISSNLASNNEIINSLLANVQGLTNDLSKLELSNTVDKSNQTLDSANAAMVNAKTLISDTKATVQGLTTTIEKLNSDQSSMGKLLNEKELYDNLNKTSENLAFLLQDLRLNPKRYLSVSVFGKKQKDYELPENDPAYNDQN